MGPELEMKPNSEAGVEVPAAKDISSHRNVEEKFMPCVSNCKDNIFDIGAPLIGQMDNDELNTGHTNPDDFQTIQGECQDSTENSSSFGDTDSGSENGSMLDGDEAESRLHGEGFASVFGGYFGGYRTRKKSLNNQWKKFRRPLMWRCKWLELKIKDLHSQALKYESELAKYDRKKLSELEVFTNEGLDAMPTTKLVKRKKRKRVEDTADIASYMSQHNLFSYESKKMSVANGVCMDDDLGDLGKTSHGNSEPVTSDIQSYLEFRDGNSSLEDILSKIEVVYSKVCHLKTQIDKVIMENPGNISPTNNFVVPYDALMSSAQNPASPPQHGYRQLMKTLSNASQQTKYNMGDLFLPQSAIPSHTELTPLPGMTGNTDQPWVGSVLENTEQEDLIHNSALKDEQHDFQEAKDILIQKPHMAVEEQKTNFAVPVSQAVLPTNSRVSNATKEPDSTTLTKFPWNTRNRGRRKPGSYKFSRKS